VVGILSVPVLFMKMALVFASYGGEISHLDEGTNFEDGFFYK
jgi:hypothetical protein